MLSRLRDYLRIGFGMLLISVNTLVHVIPLLFIAIIKMLIPLQTVRRPCSRLLAGIAASWITVNSAMISLFTRIQFQVSDIQGLRSDGSYLVLCNHQSWVDIPVLQKVFNRRIPLMRFFLKSQLIWVPVLGLAWWALDFPFMKRHSKSQIARHPELRRQDMETTRRACERFRGIPVSIMSFVEGTRFRPWKHARQSSPYRHLLRPKVGGMAIVLNAMGNVLHEVLDVTIVYPGGRPSMLDLMTNRIGRVQVYISQHRIPDDLLGGDYQRDTEYRLRLQHWINGLWEQKDKLITEVIDKGPA
jgi:1-acyl-sn-glycerol-3-phosphate acyltransferase